MEHDTDRKAVLECHHPADFDFEVGVWISTWLSIDVIVLIGLRAS